jgi:hypothetical protein
VCRDMRATTQLIRSKALNYTLNNSHWKPFKSIMCVNRRQRDMGTSKRTWHEGGILIECERRDERDKSRHRQSI